MGNGCDVAGVVIELREPGGPFEVGDEVFGWAAAGDAHSPEVLADSRHLLPKPAGLSWPVAGSLRTAAEIAFGAVRSLGPHPIMAVAVSPADGLSGLLAAQLLTATHSHAVGFAASRNVAWLAARGIRPIQVGEPVEAQLRQAAPHGLAGSIDLGGTFSAAEAIALGVDPDHVVSVRTGRTAVGHRLPAPTGRTAVLDRVSGLVSAGVIEVPVAALHDLEQTLRNDVLQVDDSALGVVALVQGL